MQKQKLTQKNVKSLITIPEDVSILIEIYQKKKRISLKKDAIIQMLIDFAKTPEGKELTH